ncbi:MAG: 6-phosphofructokinase, partial [Kiritimatiellae bacterium]|nr:6-phosphofructokinase [Kiritimatiellia bacterium]
SDAAEARQVGIEAVNAAVSGAYRSGTIAILRQPGADYQISYAVKPLSSVAKHTRELPDEYINADGNNVTEQFLEYARPIIGALPETARFNQLRK